MHTHGKSTGGTGEKTQRDNPVAMRLDILFETEDTYAEITAGKTTRPEETRPNAIVLTDRSMEVYYLILDNVIGTVRGQGFNPVDEDSWNKALEGYTHHYKFKLAEDKADLFEVDFKLVSTDDPREKPNNELPREAIRRTIRIVLEEEKAKNKRTGKYNIVAPNLFKLQDSVIECCDDLKRHVAENS